MISAKVYAGVAALLPSAKPAALTKAAGLIGHSELVCVFSQACSWDPVPFGRKEFLGLAPRGNFLAGTQWAEEAGRVSLCLPINKV